MHACNVPQTSAERGFLFAGFIFALRNFRNELFAMEKKAMRMKKPQNPFLLTGYISPDYFCDREAETEKLISALCNGRNVTLVSPRRMGKTGLINRLLYTKIKT